MVIWRVPTESSEEMHVRLQRHEFCLQSVQILSTLPLGTQVAVLISQG